MRRPLCLLCLTFVVTLAICMQFVPMPAPDYDSLDGQWLTVQGQVYQKEYKERSGSGQIPVLYLKSVHILSGFDEESDACWNSLFQQFPNYKMKNIVCYLADSYVEVTSGMEAGTGELPVMGATVRIHGQVRSFSQASNPGEFDMSEYYRVMNLEFSLEDADIEAVGGEGKILEEGLYRLKRYFSTVLEDIFPEKEASIMKAMLLGEKNGLDAETKELYQRSSIIHILSISGLHISLIGMGVYRLLKKLGMPVKMGAILSIVLIYCYGVMTGMSMSAVRAIFMFCLHLTADMVGRTYDMITALALAAVLLLLEQPRYIQYSGFLFSFGAVAGIGVLLPALYQRAPGKRGCDNPFLFGEHVLYRKIVLRMYKAARRMKQETVSGIAVTLATLPVHLIFYYQFPIYSILLNLAVIPLMTILMFAGLFILLTGGWFPLPAKGVAYANRLILWFYEVCCRLGSKIPGGVWVSGRPENWQVVLYIVLLVILVLQEKYGADGRYGFRKMPGFWKLQWILAALCVLFLRTESGWKITILDVGQGDCIHIQSGEERHYLIDGGSSTENKVFEYQILPYLKSEGVTHLDAVFITHSDTDHCSGIIDLLEGHPADGITIGSLILPDIEENSKAEQYREIESLAAMKGIKVQYMSRGQQIVDGEMSIHCVHPYKGYETENANEYSLVLLLTYGEFSGLFTGDVEGRGEDMMREYIQDMWEENADGYGTDGRLTLLKVAHHGSRYSTSDEFLRRVKPVIAVVSCGESNSYGHPHQETIERLTDVGSMILTTPKYGAITVEFGQKTEVRSWLHPD